MKNKLSYNDVPSDWALCLQDDCPRCETCLRHAAGRLMPAATTHHAVVLPAARQGDDCRLYVKNERVTMARGMKGIFAGVPSEEVPRLRKSLIGCIGSKSHYYRFRNGEYLIDPKLQARIADIFHRICPDLQPRYDNTTEAYYFPEP